MFFIVMVSVTGCSGGLTTVPSVNLLSQVDEPVYIERITFAFRVAPKSESLITEMKEALSRLHDHKEAVGRPSILSIYITNFLDLTRSRSFLRDRTNQITGSVRIRDARTGAPLYHIDMINWSNWGTQIQRSEGEDSGRDNETNMSRILVQHIKTEILIKNRVPVARNAMVEELAVRTTR